MSAPALLTDCLTYPTVTNTWYAKFLPISSTAPFDNTGLPYALDTIITNGTFDADAYHAYSPLYLSTTNVLSYGICFAILPAAVVHTYRTCC